MLRRDSRAFSFPELTVRLRLRYTVRAAIRVLAPPTLVGVLLPIVLPGVVALLLVLVEQSFHTLLKFLVSLLKVLSLTHGDVPLLSGSGSVPALKGGAHRLKVVAQTVAHVPGASYIGIVLLGVLVELGSAQLNGVTQDCRGRRTHRSLQRFHPVSRRTPVLAPPALGPRVGGYTGPALGQQRSREHCAENGRQAKQPDATANG